MSYLKVYADTWIPAGQLDNPAFDIENGLTEYSQMYVRCVDMYRIAKEEVGPDQSVGKELIRGILAKATSAGFGSGRQTEFLRRWRASRH